VPIEECTPCRAQLSCFWGALLVYAPLDPELVTDEKSPDMSDSIFEEEIRAMVPVWPLYFAGAKNMSGETTSRITDPLFLDGIRLDFAGLCNQILSADGLFVDELEVLKG
jgi:hypothetical protein